MTDKNDPARAVLDEDPIWSRLPAEKAEITRLCRAVDCFALAMKKKLIQKADDDWRGWRNKRNAGLLQRKLVEHVKRGFDASNMVDVANFCMFLWTIARRQK